MKYNKLVLLILIISISSVLKLKAQFSLTGEIRPRVEYRHGYRSMIDSMQNPGVFVSQRTRLNIGYAKDKLQTNIVLQDVRIWGNQAQLNSFDINTASLHEAWGEYKITNHFSFKAGRQEICYDDERLLGGVNWTQQGRSHDALLLKYHDSLFAFHAGGAYNQTNEINVAVPYTITSGYKELYYLWANKVFGNLSISLIEINSGFQSTASATSTRFTSTAGSHISYTGSSPISASGKFYYQFGTDANKNEVGAYMAGIEATYNTKHKISFTIGAEMLSGQSQTDTTNSYTKVTHQFNTLYATAHKFNGFMDYYFAGSGHGNIGLNDYYLKVKYKLNKWWVALDLHQFMANAEILDTEKLNQTGKYEELGSNLGFEVDLTFVYNISTNVILQAGYSHYLPTESLEVLKGGDKDKIQNWAYLMLSFKPEFLK